MRKYSVRTDLLEAQATFVELGPGTVLRGLLRTLDKQAVSWNVEDPESLQATLAGLGVTTAIGGEG